MRIEEALEKFTTQLEADGRSIHTRRQYRRHIRLFANWARDVGQCGEEIEKLGHEDVARFLAAPVATERATGNAKKATSMNCLRSSIKTFLGYCHRAGYISNDPARLIRRARCSTPPPRGLSEGDQNRFIETLERAVDQEGRRDSMLFRLMLRSGIRIGSAVALDIEDVNLETAEVRIRHAKGDAPGTIYLSAATCDELRHHIAGRTAGALFAANDGERVSVRHMQRRFAMWITRAGVTTKASPHCLRHTFAMRVYSKTGDLLLTQAALGHRSLASTAIYARANCERLRAAI
jgi:site-specific recombinase XerC